MKVLDPGHMYELDQLDEEAGCESGAGRVLTFVKREGLQYPGNTGHYAGTNIQEVLRALIDRVKYLDNQIPCPENARILRNLRDALLTLELRAAERHGRHLPYMRIPFDQIESVPTCSKCGHVHCKELEVSVAGMRDLGMDMKQIEDESKIETHCKIGQGAATCAFLLRAPEAWMCAKGSQFESLLRSRAQRGEMSAQGDNCSGPPEYKRE